MDRKKLILIDLDGTLYNFEKPDHQIIKEIFGRYKLVMLFDKFMWLINGLDIISNKFIIFKTRMLIYSLLSFSSYDDNMRKYVNRYHELILGPFVYNYYQYIRKYNEGDVFVILATHDQFTTYFQKYVDVKICVFKNKYKDIPKLLNFNDIVAIVGNNFCDDIMTAYRVNRIYKKRGSKKRVRSVYVGKSKVVELLVSGKTDIISDISYLHTII